MNLFKTHGAFSWAELMTTDTEAAKGFYGELLGWQFKSMDMPTGQYHVVSIGEEQIAGIMATPPESAGAPPFWGNYVTVDDVDALQDKVPALGGKVLVPPTDIPGVGRFMLFQDPQGAALSVITYASE